MKPTKADREKKIPRSDHRGRFFLKTKKTPTCWIWKGTKDTGGYGMISVEGKNIPTHKYSYRLHFGAIPFGFHVLHRCDIRNCVNPEHLFLGTIADNNRDCREKGRAKLGRPSKFVCRNGHLRTKENTLIRKDGKRRCGICQNKSWNKHYAAAIRRGKP